MTSTKDMAQLIVDYRGNVPRRTVVIAGAYVAGETLKAIGNVHGISKERVRQIIWGYAWRIETKQHRIQRQERDRATALVAVGPDTPVGRILPLFLQPRLRNKLRYEFGGSVLRDVLMHTDAELLLEPNFGRKSLAEWHAFIKNYQLECYWIHGNKET